MCVGIAALIGSTIITGVGNNCFAAFWPMKIINTWLL